MSSCPTNTFTDAELLAKNAANAAFQTAFCAALNARKTAIANRPASYTIGRAELVSPYDQTPVNSVLYGNTYTPEHLAMQRKIAILRYDRGLKDTKTESIIRAQSRVVRNNANGSNEPIDCPADDLIPTSSTGMNVPGAPIVFTYDPTVPLYML